MRVMTATIFVMQKGRKIWRKRGSAGLLSSMFYDFGHRRTDIFNHKEQRSQRKGRVDEDSGKEGADDGNQVQRNQDDDVSF
jgi:hypothetical protein